MAYRGKDTTLRDPGARPKQRQRNPLRGLEKSQKERRESNQPRVIDRNVPNHASSLSTTYDEPGESIGHRAEYQGGSRRSHSTGYHRINKHELSTREETYQRPTRKETVSCERRDVERQQQQLNPRGRGRGYRGQSIRGGRGRGQRNQHGQIERRQPLSSKRLELLLGKQPTEIVLELSTERSGCSELLNQNTLSTDVITLLLEVIAIACSCTTSPTNRNSFLANVWHSVFMSNHLQQFVCCLPKARYANKSDVIDMKPVANLIMLLKALLQHFPSSSSEVGVIIVLLKNATDIEDPDEIPSEILNQIKELDEIYQMFESQKINNQVEVEIAKSQSQSPPDNFRHIAVIPSIRELQGDKLPFVRHNLIKGKYQDVEHYLDVQFRLLREDFVAPLREGISEYLHNQELHLDPNKRLQDMKLYHNVHIVRLTLLRNSIAHLIQFDTTPFRRVRWESTKRLIHGSLVCLTADNFQNVIFGTIEKREVEDLQVGQVVVKFIKGSMLNRSETYLMAETSAYYEAYRHVLEGLKEFYAYTFPLQSYIIDASGKEHPPGYLSDTNSRYDLRPFLKSFETPTQDTPDQEDPEVVDEVAQVPECNMIVRSVDVLQENTWPAVEVLGFDESQMNAYKAALSKEFVLIQGPPGTGKTFVGLKIVKTLLFNFHSWCYNPTDMSDDSRPILIVCYTNHALDQFLEGIYQYEKGIVRVGGRRSSEMLEPCSLSNIRQKNRAEKKLAGHVHHSRSEISREYYKLRRKLEVAQACLELAQKGVLGISALDKYMDYRHSRSLFDGNSIVCDWLGLNNNGLYEATGSTVYCSNKHTHDGLHDNSDSESEIYIKDEAEILAEQRLLEDNQFRRKDKDFEHILENIRLEFDFLPMEPQDTTYERKEDRQRRRKMERAVASAINNLDVMTDTEAMDVQYLWQLSYTQRWRLYRFWMMKYIRDHEDTLLEHHLDYERITAALKETDNEVDYLILKSARIVGMTTTGAAKYRALLQRVRPKVIVVEEAAEVLEAHIITTLSTGCQHLILIGDHQQLRPNPTVYRLAKQYNLDVSLFERMINNGLPCYRLGLQHRMRPEISILMKNHFYTNLADHASVTEYKNVLGFSSNIFFVEHGQMERKIDDNRSKSNLHEAKFLVKLCHYVLKQGYAPSQITILTTYTGQLSNFRKLMNKATFDGVRVTVVDNFQGEENDIILLSLVRSNEERSVGFLKVANRVCVALSRAREGLFCIGNIKLLAEKSQLWKDIATTLRHKKQIGQSLPLVCQYHPNTVTEVSCASDFEKVPDGGCMVRCRARLNCGHTCDMFCHPFDPQHEQFKCQKACPKKCPREHKCPLRCHQECKCPVIMKKTFALCQHTAEVKCHELLTAKCPWPCPEKLPCYHTCPSTCGQECPIVCRQKCSKKMACGHECRRKCHGQEISCTTKSECKRTLEITLPKCDHKVSVQCNENPANTNTKSYPVCQKDCQRLLSCRQHRCPKKCREPCEKQCQALVPKKWTSCSHTIQLRCFEAATAVCRAPCDKDLPCGHKCSKTCGKQCNVSMNTCLEPCKKELPCSHPCNNRCGELCETQCHTFVNKQKPGCEHFQKVQCYVDITTSNCLAECSKQLKCGHQCQEKCGSLCTSKCKIDVFKVFPICGHTQKVPCSVEPSDTSCKAVCPKIFACGHRCRKQCGESCDEKCNMIIHIERRDCKHLQEVVCGTKPEGIKCDKSCTKMLSCNHMCAAKCSEPCTTCCKVTVQKKHPKCGHDIELQCHEDPLKIACRRPCLKTLSCGHQAEIKCSDSTREIICKQNCARELSCGHLCNKLCFQKCQTPGTTCEVMTIKTHSKCGHEVQVVCNQDPDKEACQKPCKEKLPCGHLCPSQCWQPCETVCKEKVIKTITKCGHQVKISCHVDQDNGQYCRKDCLKEMDCGHICREKCGAPCTQVCDEKVIKILPICNHPVPYVPCHVNPDTLFCRQVCGKQLVCGHACQNQCREGCHRPGNEQKNPPQCNQICYKFLKCGHLCQSRCKGCFGGRFHQPCQSRSAFSRLLCGCQFSGSCSKRLAARHHESAIASRACALTTNVNTDDVIVSEMTDPCRHILRPEPDQFCNKECEKLLFCQHPCMGICGERCPELCRFCDRRRVMRIFPEFQKIDCDPVYIQLKGCGHVFALSDLESKLNLEKMCDSCTPNRYDPIIAMTCPKCHYPLVDRRYMKHTINAKRKVLQALEEIGKLEESMVQEVEEQIEGTRFQYKLITTTEYVSQSGYGRRYRGRCKREVTQAVKREPYPESAWKLSLMKRFEVMQNKLSKLINSANAYEIRYCGVAQIDYLRELSGCLKEMLDVQQPLTDQLAHDLYNEMSRAHWCEGILTAVPSPLYEMLDETKGVLGVASKESARETIEKAAEMIASPMPFTEDRQKEVEKLMDAAHITATYAKPDTFDDVFGRYQRAQVGFEAGTWLTCHNGHVFSNREHHVKGYEGKVDCLKCKQADSEA